MANGPWILIFSVCISLPSWSQNHGVADSTSLHVGFQGYFGSILPHSSSISQLTDTWVGGLQADISRISITRASWNACNCYSQNGISISYFNFNNPGVLGGAASIAFFAEPQLTLSRMNFSLRAGAGVSYVTRVFHPDDNPENLFFSTPWSGLLLAQLNSRYRLNDAWLLRIGASYQHISNGGKRQPNKGMNFPTLSLGVDYSLKAVRLPRREKLRIKNKSIRYYAGMFYNTRAIDESDLQTADREVVLGLQGGFYVPVVRMHAVGVGLEASYDGALKERARGQRKSFDHHVVSILLRHHFLFGRFDFSQALGIYVYKEYPTPAEVFQRYALHYRLWRKLQLGFSLKAHLHTAEQMDVRLGYLF